MQKLQACNAEWDDYPRQGEATNTHISAES